MMLELKGLELEEFLQIEIILPKIRIERQIPNQSYPTRTESTYSIKLLIEVIIVHCIHGKGKTHYVLTISISFI